MFRTVMKWLLKTCFRVEVKGLQNLHNAGKRVVIVVNHISFIDGLLLGCFLPKEVIFTVNTEISKLWYVKPFLSMIRYFTLDPTQPFALKKVIQEVRKDQTCVIFPEGRITVTGSLMKIYEGPAAIADKANAAIVPVHIDGAQYSYFGYLKGIVKRRVFPKITIRVMAATSIQVNEESRGKVRRKEAKDSLYNIMSNMVYQAKSTDETVWQRLSEQVAMSGRRQIISQDITFKKVNYGKLLTGAFVLGEKFEQHSNVGDYVGLLLPNSNAALVAFFGLQAHGRVPAMLNYSAGIHHLISACKTAKLQHIYSSKTFIEKGKLEHVVEAIKNEGINIHYLEDIAATISIQDKLKGVIKSYSPEKHAKPVNPDDAAVVLFTSGSEGLPKGVVLSHRNILSNCAQLAARVDFNPQDKIFNALPIFHSFGLTAATLLPALNGIEIFFYPSPLHYRNVPELVYQTNATLMFGTDTFLNGYARFADRYDFYRLRYIFTGAEKLKAETLKRYSESYGVQVFEGYGATETSPVISVNTPMHQKSGTVGKILPNIRYKLEEVNGVETGGRLWVQGDNIMKGYLMADKPGELQPPEDKWYDTGDIVSIDNEGYLKIEGRAKRFVKIAGEMISLGSVEQEISALWPNSEHAVIGIPDAKKGEALVLYTTEKNANKADIKAHIQNQGLSGLSMPKEIEIVDSLPLLGSGKVDYTAIKALREEEQ